MIAKHQSKKQNYKNGSDLFDLYAKMHQSGQKRTRSKEQNNIHSFFRIIFFFTVDPSGN